MLFIPSGEPCPPGLFLIPCQLFRSPGCNLGCLKGNQNQTQWAGSSGSILALTWGRWCRIHPWHFSITDISLAPQLHPSDQHNPRCCVSPCPGDSPAAGCHRGAIPRLWDAAAALLCQALVEMSPPWQPDRRAPQDPPSPPRWFSLPINTGANLTPFPCLALVSRRPLCPLIRALIFWARGCRRSPVKPLEHYGAVKIARDYPGCLAGVSDTTEAPLWDVYFESKLTSMKAWSQSGNLI